MSERPLQPIRRPLSALTLAEQTALLEASLEVELRELSRAGTPEWGDEAGLAWVVGATPGAVVYETAIQGDDVEVDARIGALTKAFATRDLAVTWWVRPNAEPADLRDRLERAGYVLADEEAGMAADLSALPLDLAHPPDLRFTTFGGDDPELDEAQVDAWLDVAGITFGWLPSRYEVRRALYLGDTRRPRPWRHHVGWLGDRPVAMARVLLAAGVAMVHGVAVVPDVRRRGIGTAITAAALWRARDREGYRIAVLQASSMGRGPYERIGFRTVATYGRYEREARPPAADARPVEAMPAGAPAAAEARPAPPSIVDAWCFVGPYRERDPGTPYELDELLVDHHRLGIGARLILHAESRDGVPDEGNAAMSRIAIVTPRTGVIWTALPPRRFDGVPAERLLGDAEGAGVAMFAVLPETHRHDVAPWAMGELYAAMESARLPLTLDLEQTSYADVHAIATAYPRLPILCWGAWYMDERLHVPLLDACPNVRIGLAGTTRIFNPTFGIERYTERYGPGRLIFGSAWPRQAPGGPLTYVRYADVKPAVRAAILGETVRELLANVRWSVQGFREAAS